MLVINSKKKKGQKTATFIMVLEELLGSDAQDTVCIHQYSHHLKVDFTRAKKDALYNDIKKNTERRCMIWLP